MDLPVNRFKAALRERRKQLGFWCSLCSPIATEVVGGAGFDWIVIDQEHTINDAALTLQQLQALGSAPGTPILRLPWNDPVTFKRMLDIGATSFLVPFVQTAQEAAAAVSATRYPPLGTRGAYLASRGRLFGRVDDYFDIAHEQIAVLVQVETAKGLANLEKIAAVEGLDGIFIGPNDLAADLGHVGKTDHPDVRKAVLEVPERLKGTGCAVGTMTFADLGAADLFDAGFTFVSVGSDTGLLVKQTDMLVAKNRP